MRLQAATIGTKAYFISGMGDTCATCQTVDVFDTANSTWATFNLTRGRYEFVAVALKDRLMVAGGKQGAPTPWNATEASNWFLQGQTCNQVRFSDLKFIPCSSPLVTLGVMTDGILPIPWSLQAPRSLPCKYP